MEKIDNLSKKQSLQLSVLKKHINLKKKNNDRNKLKKSDVKNNVVVLLTQSQRYLKNIQNSEILRVFN